MRALALAVLALLAIEAAWPLDPQMSVDQYEHRQWDHHSAAPKGIIAFAQTTDGSLWWVSHSGPGYFDGSVFSPWTWWQTAAPGSLGTAAVAAADGSLWVGYEFGGVLRINGRTQIGYRPEQGLPAGKVHALVEDRGGTIWVATERGVGRFSAGKWDRIEDWSFAASGVYGAYVTRDDALLLATLDAVFSIDPGRKQVTKVRTLSAFKGTKFFAETSDGRVLFNSPGSGIVELNSSRGPWFQSRQVNQILIDSDDILWMGGDALRKLDLKKNSPARSAAEVERSVDEFSRADGLTGDEVTALFEDRFGSLWVATNGGLDHFADTPVVALPLPENMSSWGTQLIVKGNENSVWVAASGGPALLKYSNNQLVAARHTGRLTAGVRGPKGDVWFAGSEGLLRIRDDDVTSVPFPKAISGDDVRALAEDGSGAIWIFLEKSGLHRFGPDGWSFQGGISGLPRKLALSATTDSNGDVWLGYENNLLARISRGAARTYSAADGLNVGGVLALTHADGALWIGGELGLSMFDGRRFHHFNVTTTAPMRSIFGFAYRDGDLWIHKDGALNLARNVRAFTSSVETSHDLDVLGFNQRIVDARPASFPMTATIALSDDGRLWLSDGQRPKVVAAQALIGFDFNERVDRHGRRVDVLPVITQMTWRTYGRDGNKTGQYINNLNMLRGQDGHLHPATQSEALRLAPHTRDVEFSFRSPVQRLPLGSSFRTRLVGNSDEWQFDTGQATTTAVYRNLRPGKYRFEVVAESGRWSPELPPPATLSFEILPAFYQTHWFRALCVLAVAGFIALLFRFQVRRVAVRLQERLEARLSERERIARDLHDTLLQGVQGLMMKVYAATLELPPERATTRRTLEDALDAAQSFLVEGRDRVSALRDKQLARRNVTNDIAIIGERLAIDHQIDFRASVHGVVRALHPIVQEETLLVVREALHNAFEHAKARSIRAETYFEKSRLRVVISDDGSGIPEDILMGGGRKGHWGLRGMRERAVRLRGSLEIKADSGSGTRVELRVPAAVAFGSSGLRRRWLSFLPRMRRHDELDSDL